MDLAVEQKIREIFALAAAAESEKRFREGMEAFLAEFDRKKRDEKKTKEKEEKEAKEVEEMLAAQEQIAAFDQRLDDLDTKTVHCLMENGEALDKQREQLREMRDNAYVLPDGRRVFKTQDGQHVFDERGAEVGRESVDPHMIDGHHTTWESFGAAKESQTKLEEERRRLLEFQAKIDEARARADKGGMTKKELDALGADLEASAPPSVRQKLGAERKLDERSLVSRSGALLSDDLGLKADDLPRRSGMAPAPM